MAALLLTAGAFAGPVRGDGSEAPRVESASLSSVLAAAEAGPDSGVLDARLSGVPVTILRTRQVAPSRLLELARLAWRLEWRCVGSDMRFLTYPGQWARDVELAGGAQAGAGPANRVIARFVAGAVASDRELARSRPGGGGPSQAPRSGQYSHVAAEAPVEAAWFDTGFRPAAQWPGEQLAAMAREAQRSLERGQLIWDPQVDVRKWDPALRRAVAPGRDPSPGLLLRCSATVGIVLGGPGLPERRVLVPMLLEGHRAAAHRQQVLSTAALPPKPAVLPHYDGPTGHCELRRVVAALQRAWGGALVLPLDAAAMERVAVDVPAGTTDVGGVLDEVLRATGLETWAVADGDVVCAKAVVFPVAAPELVAGMYGDWHADVADLADLLTSLSDDQANRLRTQGMVLAASELRPSQTALLRRLLRAVAGPEELGEQLTAPGAQVALTYSACLQLAWIDGTYLGDVVLATHNVQLDL